MNSAFIASLAETPWLQPLYAQSFYGNPLAHWVYIGVSVVLAYLIGTTVSLVIEKFAQHAALRTRNKVDDMILEVVNRSLTSILVLVVLLTGTRMLELPEMMDMFIEKLLFILFTVKIASELEHLVSFFIEEFLEPLAKKQKGFLKTFIPPILRLSKFVVWSLAVLLIINNLGYNITSLLAGLGIGGIAIALAAQETLGNAFGSFSILTDQPFKIGDFVEIDGEIGQVLEVGMRSTRIRTLDGTQVCLPNKTVANSRIRNLADRSHFNVNFILNLEYGTSSKKMLEFLKELPKVLKRDKDVDSQSVRVHFAEYGSFSLDVQVFYNIQNKNYSLVQFLDIRQRLHLKTLELVDKLNIALAFPTQHLILENAKPKSKARKK